MLLNFLSAYSPRVVDVALKRKNQAEKEERVNHGWQIWQEKSPPPPPYEWMQVEGEYYYRYPVEYKPVRRDVARKANYREQADTELQPNMVPKTSSSGSGCQGCSDTKGANRGSISKGLVGLAKAQFGIGRAPDKLVADRKAICMGCPANDIGRCAKCGCYIHAKIRIRKEACPLRRW